MLYINNFDLHISEEMAEETRLTSLNHSQDLLVSFFIFLNSSLIPMKKKVKNYNRAGRKK